LKKIFSALLIFSAIIIIPASSSADKAVKIEASGLTNFYKTSDDLYRGAMPSKEGLLQLKKLGIKTVINLQTFHSDRKKIEGKIPELNYIHIEMQAWRTEDKDTIQFINIIKDKKNLPVFIHCYHGSDRTGMMNAIYRIFFQGWSKEKAIDEMKNGGFGFHKEFEILAEYLKKLDVDKIKKETGL
jgi:protein tyrosine/serine phosphatase